MIEAPEFLVGAARGKWAQLVATGAYDDGDGDALAAYSAAYGRWVAAEDWLAAPSNGPVVTVRDDKGNVRIHGVAPQLAVAERALREMGRLGKALRVERALRRGPGKGVT